MARRIVLIAVSVVLAAAAVLAGVLYYVLSGDGIRRALEQQAAGWLGEPVHIGSAGAQLFPRVALHLEDVRIGEPVRLTLAEADLSTSLRALLSRRIEDADVLVSNSRITLPLPARLATATLGTADSASSALPIHIASVRTIALRDVRILSRGRELLISADSSLRGTTLTVPRFDARSGRTELQAEGTVELAPRVDARLRVKAGRLDVDELLALAEAFTAPGATAQGAPDSGSGLPGRIAARVSAEAATAAGVDVRQLSTDLEIDGTAVSLSPVSFQLFGGKYQGSLNGRLGERMTATLRSRVMDIDVGQLAAFGGLDGAVTGHLTGAGTFTGEGSDLSAIVASARGQGTAEIVNGTIRGLDLVRTVVLFFGRPEPDAAPGSDRFERISATFSVAARSVRAQALSLHSQDADIAGSGTLDIASKALDGRFDLALSEALSAQAGTDLRRYTREGDRVVLPARLGGTLGNPRLTIDAEAALKRGLRNEVERRLKGLLDDLKAR